MVIIVDYKNALRGIFMFFMMTVLCREQDTYASVVKQMSGDLSFRYQDFVNNVGGVEGNKWWGELNFIYDDKEPFVDHEAKFDFTARYNDAGGFEWALREGQITYLREYSEFSMGLIVFKWSEIDRIWGLGKINNRVNIDYFNPGQSGLPGFRFNQRLAKSLEIETYASFLYIPELNPSYKINKEEGTVVSKNPWAPPPEQETTITSGGEPKKIFYHVFVPDFADIILKLSAGFNIRYSFFENLHLSGFYLQKPENNLSNTAKLEINSNTLQPNIYVTPRLYYHEIWGGQITYETKTKQIQLYTSYLSSKPDSKPENKDVVEAGGFPFQLEKQQEEYWGTGLIYLFLGGSIHIGQLSRVSTFNDNSVLSKKPRWGEAANLSLVYNFYPNLSFFTEIFYDYSNHDRLFSVDLTYVLNQSLALSLGANVLTSPQNGVGFWNPFKANDSIYAKLGLVF